MNILVSGSKGFIGKRVVEKLENHSIIHCNRSDGFDITKPETLRFFNNKSIDTIIHLAGKHFVPESWEHPQSYINTNVEGTVNMLNLAKEHDARFINISTFVYAKPSYIPIDENHPTTPLNPYALSKFLAEQACEFYAKSFSLRIINLRLFNVYGPEQNENFLFPKLFNYILKDSNTIEVQVLEPKRDFIYVDDVASAIKQCTSIDFLGYDNINIGSGTSYSVAQAISLLKRLYESEIPVVVKGKMRKNEIMDTKADISKAMKKLQWSPKFTLEEGFRKMKKYYCEKQ